MLYPKVSHPARVGTHDIQTFFKIGRHVQVPLSRSRIEGDLLLHHHLTGTVHHVQIEHLAAVRQSLGRIVHYVGVEPHPVSRLGIVLVEVQVHPFPAGVGSIKFELVHYFVLTKGRRCQSDQCHNQNI